MFLPILALMAVSSTSIHVFPGAVAAQRTTDATIFLVNPEGGVQAIQVSSGRALWQSKEALWPLEFSGGFVICARAGSESHTLKIVSLDEMTGKLAAASPDISLPAWSAPQFNYDSDKSFEIVSEPKNGKVQIRWVSDRNVSVGIALNPVIANRPDRRVEGAVSFDPATGSIESLPVHAALRTIKFPSQATTDLPDKTLRVLWTPEKLGDLAIYIAEQVAPGEKLPADHKLWVVAVESANSTYRWRVSLGRRHIAMLRM